MVSCRSCNSIASLFSQESGVSYQLRGIKMYVCLGVERELGGKIEQREEGTEELF